MDGKKHEKNCKQNLVGRLETGVGNFGHAELLMEGLERVEMKTPTKTLQW